MSPRDDNHHTPADHTHNFGKAPHMGASRDYTTGNDGSLNSYGHDGWGRRGDTATIPRVRDEWVSPARSGRVSDDKDHRAARRAAEAAQTSFARPTREAPEIRPHREHTGRGARTGQGARVGSTQRYSRVGSSQVLSVRGRRATATRTFRRVNKLSFYAIGLLLAGVCLAMWLSGMSTAQTFTIQQLSDQESTLDNQLETLNRDLENVRSSADIARRAAEDSLVVPDQPGIVEVEENGDIAERRAAKPESESIIDVNGAPVRPGQASSDPHDTADVAGSLSSVPHGQQAAQPGTVVNPQIPVQAPYAATSRN